MGVYARVNFASGGCQRATPEPETDSASRRVSVELICPNHLSSLFLLQRLLGVRQVGHVWC